jgi:CRISPR-associated protein Csb2
VILLLSARLLDDRFHGRAANGERPDWPPSCFRLFQAIIAGNARGLSIPPEVVASLKWLETLRPPIIIVPPSQPGNVILSYVLNNTESRSRTQKFIRPTLLRGDRLIEFAWEFDPDAGGALEHAKALLEAVRHIRAFGWGIDLAVGHGVVMDRLPEQSESRSCFFPRENPGGTGIDIRVPRVGSFASLQDCYRQYLDRFDSNESTVLESGGPLFQPWPYAAGAGRPRAVFKLLNDDDDTVAYPHARLIHIAGMVRHAAIELMTRNPPRDLRGLSAEQWLEEYVAGHQSAEAKSSGRSHTQFSYVPLPSAGHEHTDPAIRRVMIVAPLGDDSWLDHLAQHLDGRALAPLPGTTLPPGTHLEQIPDERKDGVRDAFTRVSRLWASFTPVILPGHDDHRPEKTRKLVLNALTQSGIDQPCEFAWSAFSRFPKSYSAHKYVRDESDPEGKRRVGYFRPNHLANQTAVHVELKFVHPVSGPITIGAGRHCGFGLFAAVGK